MTNINETCKEKEDFSTFRRAVTVNPEYKNMGYFCALILLSHGLKKMENYSF